MAVIITGSSGLIGSESARFFADKGHEVVGIDNDMRRYFFGESASTDWNRKQLIEGYSNYRHQNVDIRDRPRIENLIRQHDVELIIHTAAQPSHDWAAREPHTDFSINALGTLNLLEATRLYAPEAVFIFTSTNKVYGDTPNHLPLIEQEKRWEISPSHPYFNGIDESMSIDASKHSLFGASKVAADILTQEYGLYFGLKTIILRGGCLTGPMHSGAELHGFLAYLIRCILMGKEYQIFGYKGKQVRDNIHSYDLVNAFYHAFQNPKSGEVYNIGGGRNSNISMLEAIEKIESLTGRKVNTTYESKNRIGDHIWYISDITKFQSHYPNWNVKYTIDQILSDMIEGIVKRL